MLDKIHASWSRGFIIYFYFAAERNLKYLDFGKYLLTTFNHFKGK